MWVMVGGGSKGGFCSFPPAIPRAFIQEPSRAETEWASKTLGPEEHFLRTKFANPSPKAEP